MTCPCPDRETEDQRRKEYGEDKETVGQEDGGDEYRKAEDK